MQTEVKKANSFFFLLRTVENSDHTLLRVINMRAFGLLYLLPNEKQRSALERVACLRLWKTKAGKKKKKKKAFRIIQTICVLKGPESSEWVNRPYKKKKQDMTLCVISLCGIRCPFARQKNKICMEGRFSIKACFLYVYTHKKGKNSNELNSTKAHTEAQ